MSGPIGFGKIWVPGLVLGLRLISFLLPLFSSSRTPDSLLGFWLSPISLMLSSARLGCLFFWSGHTVVTADQFLDFVGHLLPQEPDLDLPRITGRDLQEVARAKKSTAGGLDGWAWNELKALPLPLFSGLAILLELVETSGVWPQGLLDAYIAIIPKADGFYPLGQPPSLCSLLCTGCGLPFGWTSPGVG